MMASTTFSLTTFSLKFEESMIKFENDLSKRHKLSFRETESFRKYSNVEITFQKFSVSREKLRCAFNKSFFIKESSYRHGITFCFHIFLHANVILKCCKSWLTLAD